MGEINNKIPVTLNITKAGRIKFNQTAAKINEVAVTHNREKVGLGELLDKLIEKFSDKITYEDFFPTLYKGNVLKEKQ